MYLINKHHLYFTFLTEGSGFLLRSDLIYFFVTNLSVSLVLISSNSTVSLSVSLMGVGACHVTLCGPRGISSWKEDGVRMTGVTEGDRVGSPPACTAATGGMLGKLEPEDLLDFLEQPTFSWCIQGCLLEMLISVNKQLET